MANATDIANNAAYVGNANLGGGNYGVIKIDTKPLENLAAYTYAYNKTKWEQAQKDAEAKATELADVTSYDLTTAIPNDSKEIQKQWGDFYKYVQDNPNVLDYKNNPSGYLEYKKRKNELENNLRDVKSRNIIYKAGKTAAEKETNPELKALMDKRLDEQAANTDIHTPIRLQEYDAKVVDVPTPQQKTFDVYRVDQNGNFNADREMAVISLKDIKNKSAAISLGLQADVLDQNSTAFKTLTPKAQKLKIEEFENKKASGRLLVVDQAQTYTEALKSPEYQKADGSGVDFDKIKATNPILAGTIKAFDEYNKYVDSMSQQIKAGAFRDKQGKAIAFGMENLDESDYAPINYTDGISPEELLQVQMLAKAKPDSYETKITQTDLAIKKDDNAIKWADLGLKKQELGLKQKEFESKMKGSETQVNGAMERAKRIYADLKSLADSQGVISPDKVRQLNVEQLKYLGIEVPAERNDVGQIISQGGFKPLDLSGDNEYAIKLDDKGNIQVLAPNKGKDKTNTKLERVKKGKDVVLVGQFDNSKSTNLWNIGTNILNEELKNAGTKELNSYIGVDVTGKGTSFTNTTESSVKSSSGGTKTSYKANGKTYTKDELNKMGYTDEQIAEAVRLKTIQ